MKDITIWLRDVQGRGAGRRSGAGGGEHGFRSENREGLRERDHPPVQHSRGPMTLVRELIEALHHPRSRVHDREPSRGAGRPPMAHDERQHVLAPAVWRYGHEVAVADGRPVGSIRGRGSSVQGPVDRMIRVRMTSLLCPDVTAGAGDVEMSEVALRYSIPVCGTPSRYRGPLARGTDRG